MRLPRSIGRRPLRRGRLLVGTVLAATALAPVLAQNASAVVVPPQPSRPLVTSPAQIAQLRAQVRAGTLSRTRGVTKVCASHHAHCLAEAVTTSKGSSALLITGKPIGYGPADLQKAYNASGSGTGTGTIAILDAGAYPNLESDLTIYRDTYGLPRCTTASGCLRIVGYKGGKPADPTTDPFGQFVEEEVAVETALDVQMASAACPKCKIVVGLLPWQDAAPQDQAAEDVATTDFAIGTQTAVRLGAKAVSISYGYDSDTYNLTGAPAKGLRQPGVAVFASSGDSGFTGSFAAWPQALTTVISAGGTSLYTSATPRGFTDVAWAGAGSSCALTLPPANGQPASVAEKCGGKPGHRASSDISAVADPNTGVAVYDSYAPATGFPPGFLLVGGTSASSPFLAGLAVRAGVPATTLGPNLVYKAPASTLVDVTLGQNAPPGACGFDNALCISGPGWDGPSGRGVPNGTAVFKG